MRWTTCTKIAKLKCASTLIAAMIIKHKLTNLEQFNPQLRNQTKTNLRFVRQQVMECGGTLTIRICTAGINSAKSAMIVRELQGMGWSRICRNLVFRGWRTGSWVKHRPAAAVCQVYTTAESSNSDCQVLWLSLAVLPCVGLSYPSADDWGKVEKNTHTQTDLS